MKKSLLFACLIAVVTIPAAYAQEQGAYIGLGVTSVGHSSFSSDSKSAFKLFGGYDFTPTWGVEAGYMALPRFGTDQVFYGPGSNRLPTGYGADTDGKAMYIAGKATMAINDKFGVVTKLGLSHERVHETFSSSNYRNTHSLVANDLYAGIGLTYAVTKKVGLALELERLGSANGSGFKPKKVSINASYRF